MRSVCYSITCLLMLSVSLCVVHSESGTEIILNGTTTIFFPGNQIDRFCGCLCNDSSNICTVFYQKEEGDYKIIETKQTSNFSRDRQTRTYRCKVQQHDLSLSNEFHCQGLNENQDSFSCEQTSICDSCGDIHVCVSWLYDGSPTVAEKNDVTDTEESSKNEDDDIPLIAGLVCGTVVIILIILIVFIVCRRQRQKCKAPDNKTTCNAHSVTRSRNTTSSVARSRGRTNSNYEQCEIETGGLGSSENNIENCRRANTGRGDDNYTTVETGNGNTPDKGLDDYGYTTVGNTSDDTKQNKSTKAKPDFSTDNNYSTIDTERFHVFDLKSGQSSTVSSNISLSGNVESENIEYAVVDKSKKSPKNKAYVNTLDDASKEPHLSVSATVADDNPSTSENCQYTEVVKPKPNPKNNIYAKLGEQVRGIKNPYNVV